VPHEHREQSVDEAATGHVAGHVVWFEDVGGNDVPRVGRKIASLGEMIRSLRNAGVSVPPGFATTSDAYWRFVKANDLRKEIRQAFDELREGKASLAEAGPRIRGAFLRADWPEELARALREAYAQLSQRFGVAAADVAVRSSAAGADLPDEASFAGQLESFLNVRGEQAVLDACRRCYASLFTDRAISYGQAKGFDHPRIALSVGIQKMVRSDLGGAGVMFSLDAETGFDKVVLIDVQCGIDSLSVSPDRFVAVKHIVAAAEHTKSPDG
jgi:pyruvate,water dikinase